jgi:serine/threonine protein phosphatase PrpC
MGNSLDNPNTAKDSESYISSIGYKCGLSGMQGWRTEMEDSHLLLDMPSLPDHLIAAVFDGHGGVLTANYAAKNMIEIIEKSTNWKQYLITKNTDDLSKALIDAFLKIDLKMIADGFEMPMQHCGCTAVVAIITPTHIVCSNAGDSRCVLGFNKTSKNMSEDHKPTLEVESRRVRNAGGT